MGRTARPLDSLMGNEEEVLLFGMDDGRIHHSARRDILASSTLKLKEVREKLNR